MKTHKTTIAGVVTLIVMLLILTALSSSTQTISSRNLRNNPSKLGSYILSAYNGGATNVNVPPGTYTLTAASGEQFAAHLSNIKNLRITLTGVTLLSGPNTPFIFLENCSNVMIVGGIFRHSPIPFSQGKVIAISSSRASVDIAVSGGYPTNLTDSSYFPGNGWFNVFDPVSRSWKPGITDIQYSSIQSLGSGTFRFALQGALDSNTPLKVGDLAAWRGNGAPDVYLYGCASCGIQGATFQSSSGFAVFELTGAGQNIYSSITVQRGPVPSGGSESPLLSANANGIHSEWMANGPKISNCNISYTGDDAIAVTGVHSIVLRTSGNTLLVAAPGSDFCYPGDILHLYDSNEGWIADAAITGVTSASDPGTGVNYPPSFDRLYKGNSVFLNVQLNQAPSETAAYAANGSKQGAGFLISGCSVLNNRARGIIIKSSNGVIESNSVTGSTWTGIALVPEFQDWVEADYSRNITIRNKTISNQGTWQDSGYWMAGALTIAEFSYDTSYYPLPGGHLNITVSGNTFSGNNGANIVLSSARNVTFSDNTFSNPMTAYSDKGYWCGVDPGALYWVTQSSGITIQNNTIMNQGPYLRTVLSATATANVTVK